jgi:hypothetical protein
VDGESVSTTPSAAPTTPSAEAASTPPLAGGELNPDGASIQEEELDEWDECEFEKPFWMEESADQNPRERESENANGSADSHFAIRVPQLVHGPHACPFIYDSSPEAERWFMHLVKTYPERTERAILRDYVAGEPWCRPPGAVPPYDPNNPFSKMEATIDDNGNKIFVEERDNQGSPRIWYQYGSNGALRRWVRDGNSTSGGDPNPNLFGRFVKIEPKSRTRPSRQSRGFTTSFGF